MAAFSPRASSPSAAAILTIAAVVALLSTTTLTSNNKHCHVSAFLSGPTVVVTTTPSSSSLSAIFPTKSSSPWQLPLRMSSTTEESTATVVTSTNANGGNNNNNNNMFDDFLNEEEMLQRSEFPIKPKDLMDRARYVLGPECGIGTVDDAKCLADDFEFVAAVVGPIRKAEYIGALENFNLADSFTIRPNYFGMTVDPMQPNRVWFFNRVRGEHDRGTFMGAKPDGKQIVYPPQTLHLDFNEDGLVKEFGFYTSDRRQGNTGGLGGAFGFMYGVGKPLPIPECAPYKPSKRFQFLNFVGSIGRKLASNNNKKKKD